MANFTNPALPFSRSTIPQTTPGLAWHRGPILREQREVSQVGLSAEFPMGAGVAAAAACAERR